MVFLILNFSSVVYDGLPSLPFNARLSQGIDSVGVVPRAPD